MLDPAHYKTLLSFISFSQRLISEVARSIDTEFYRMFDGDCNLYKRRAVAAQTARSHCKVLCIHSLQYVEAYYFRAYQRQKTLDGVGVITKLYFAIFAAFKE